jgi:hypothetical protein
MYRARVLGEFPGQSEMSVYSLTWIERASREPDLAAPNNGVIQVGIDVAGPGEDETVMVARVGGAIIAQQVCLCLILGEPCWPRSAICGGPLPDWARRGGYGRDWVSRGHASGGPRLQRFWIQRGSAPLDPEHFVNAKAEGYWTLREWLERGVVSGPTDEEMQAQLVGILYRHTASGRVEIESKEDAKKRGQSSLDRAEACVPAFARSVPRKQTVVSDDRVRISPI